jgi:Flp pilus assembly protein TadG
MTKSMSVHRRPRPRSRRGLLRGDGGSATVEVAVLFPALLLLVFGGVQTAEWYHARSLCLAAADAGVWAARPAGAELADGRAAAAAFLAHTGGSLSDVTVSTVGSTATLVRVQVSGTAPRVLPIPGLTMRVSQSAQAPREVFTVDGGR